MGLRNEKILDDEDQVDLGKASLSLELSSTGFDEETQEFHVSMDRALFNNPVAIISTVLEANGFILNIENILAALDQLKFAPLVKSGSRGSSSTIKYYLPCLKFQLPSKGQVGPTLKRFYEEIQHYELAINELQQQEKAPVKGQRKSEQHKEQIMKLEEENKLLKQEVSDLKLLLNRAVKSEATANKALASQNLLPNDIRLGIVRELNIEDRQILLKSGRTSISVPMALSPILPNVKDKCLVHYDKGNVIGCFFYETTGILLKPILSQILAKDSQVCKVRDINRRTWCITIKNEEEAKMLSSLSRKDYLQLFIFDQQILRFSPMVGHSKDFTAGVLESLARDFINSPTLNHQTAEK